MVSLSILFLNGWSKQATAGIFLYKVFNSAVFLFLNGWSKLLLHFLVYYLKLILEWRGESCYWMQKKINKMLLVLYKRDNYNKLDIFVWQIIQQYRHSVF